jgi:hypothetical protein
VTPLADQLQAHAEALVERALQAMYANPFWEERFGERGRQFARTDNHHHLSYLALALRVGSPEPLARYARWLQEVLTTRGMCTRHLSANFAWLADAISAEGLEGGDEARAYLRAAQEALLYPADPARALQAVATQVAGRALQTLYARRPEWLDRWGEAGRNRCADDLVYHLSYLTDALALGRAELFAEYVAWVVGFLARRSIPVEHLVEALEAIGQALQLLPVPTRDAARVALGVGRSRLGTSAP